MFFTANGSRKDPFLEILQYDGQGGVWRRLRKGMREERVLMFALALLTCAPFSSSSPRLSLFHR